jgi:ABC-type multidrug transport system ATPase subunit
MVCDQVAFIKGGRIIDQGRPDQMGADGAVVELHVDVVSDGLLDKISPLARIVSSGSTTIRAAVRSREDIPELARAVVGSGGRLYRLAHEKVSLEEIFINLLKEGD